MTSLTLSKSTLAVGGLTAAGLIVAAVIGVQRLSAQSDGDGPRAGEASVQTVLENPASEPASPADTTLVLARSDGDDEESPSEGASHQSEENSKRDPAATPPQDEIPTDLKRRRPAEKKIEAALEERVNLEFFDTPLTEVMGYIEDVHKITILFDQSALQEFGISADTPVTVELSDVTLESGLDIILQDVVGELTYVVEDEVMKITTVEAAEKKIETRVYPVQDLVQAGFELDGLKEIVEQDAAEGATVTTLPGFLVITQGKPGHRRTAEVLEQLHRAAAMQSK